jgi:DTW domain-containing protein YfiP
MHRSLCICALIPRITTRTRLLLILHQLEHKKPTNTGRLAVRCLANSAIAVRGASAGAGRGAPAEPVSSLWADTQPVLLFPHAEARPLDEWRACPLPITLVVPDGTWRQAKKARRRFDGLDSLPCATLPVAERSPHRLRHDARPDHLSTIEAIGLAMAVLEGAEVQQQLEHIRRVMVDRTLWSNGRMASDEVTGGIPAGARPHNPFSVA